jgi:hypothetical protein
LSLSELCAGCPCRFSRRLSQRKDLLHA